MNSKSLYLPDGLAGYRADAALSKLLGLSRSFCAEIINKKGLYVNGRLVDKSDKLNAGSWLDISWEEPRKIEVTAHEVIGFDVVYDDDDIVVVNKPYAVAAHPSLGWSGPDVLGALLAGGYKISTSGPAERNGIVSRLDVGTSGLMVVAKSEIAYGKLKQAFKNRLVKKTYHALVQGHPDPFTGTIDAPIGRHPSHEWKFAITKNGKNAVTHYKTIEAYNYATLIDVKIETGRTHQIRVHMSAQKHPCVGDETYGADPKLSKALMLERQWLHSKELEFAHPTTEKIIKFTSEYAPDLQKALDILENGIIKL